MNYETDQTKEIVATDRDKNIITTLLPDQDYIQRNFPDKTSFFTNKMLSQNNS